MAKPASYRVSIVPWRSHTSEVFDICLNRACIGYLTHIRDSWLLTMVCVLSGEPQPFEKVDFKSRDMAIHSAVEWFKDRIKG